MEKVRKIIPDYAAKWLFLILLFNTIAYNGGRYITKGRIHYNLSSWIDYKIPMLSWTVIIYLGCYAFWIINYVLAVREDKDKARRFAISEIVAKSICFFIYLTYPTTMARGTIVGDGIFDNVLRFVYQIDAADNLFPSIHCLVSWFCYLGIRESKIVPRWYKNVSIALAIMVFVSTLTVKQHVIADVFSGIIIAEVSYDFCNNLDRLFAKRKVEKIL